MNSGKARVGAEPAQMTPSELMEELGQLLRDLHGLLDSYGPLWYTEEIDQRLVQMLGQVSFSSSSLQGRREEAGAQRCE